MNLYQNLIWIFCIYVTATLAVVAQETNEPLFNQKVSDSNSLRTRQAGELDGYIKTISADTSRFKRLFKPNYSSADAFERSAEPLILMPAAKKAGRADFSMPA